MSDKTQTQKLVIELTERAKELKCLYEVEELLNQRDRPIAELLTSLTRVLCPGWQHPDICFVTVSLNGHVYRSGEHEPTEWRLSENIRVQDEVVGTIAVHYLEERPPADIGPFLKEESRLLKTIADRIGHFLLFMNLQDVNQKLNQVQSIQASSANWRSPLELLLKSDRDLYQRIARKMLNYLCSIGIAEAQAILQGTPCFIGPADVEGEVNKPVRKQLLNEQALRTFQPFELASQVLGTDEILARVQRWMQEDKVSLILPILDNPQSSLKSILTALRRYQHMLDSDSALPLHLRQGLIVSLSRRFLTEQLDVLSMSKDVLEVSDFHSLTRHLIASPDSHGKVGGKGAGLLMASKILSKIDDGNLIPFGHLRTPKTWYLASDGIMDFVRENELEDLIEQKYKDIEQVRHEYPNIIQLFKNSCFPPHLVQGLSMALDDLADKPLIVRSSSLLEDRLGSAFSGKYKSLFLANQGDKSTRLEALMDAISEVYASLFAPDPLAYRQANGLIDFGEEMGILIQEVVGERVGRYFLPAFAGVVFSNNEFRWSPRIQRKDGLLRMVPGLGTRAVDRLDDDYPFLAAPGKPNLRVNTAPDEILRYSPKKMDVIDMESNSLVTVDVPRLLAECGTGFPMFEKLFSVYRDGMFSRPSRLLCNPEKDTLVANFDGLLASTDFVKQVGEITRLLQENLNTPVDIEFAVDGEAFYLLQCRPQCFTEESAPAAIPQDVPQEQSLFTARQFVSNGWVPDITHIVYVDPARYEQLADRAQMLEVGRAVGRLNKLLPKRQFILMGPGRWGSRGDIKLGVNVTYADINNTAVMIEIARQRGNYIPDLSFGTHFFQDLVESSIRYLPLYPDDNGIVFNERFLLGSPNILAEIAPDFESLSDVVRVIDVPRVTGGRILRVLMNAELNEALALFAQPERRAQVRELPRPLISDPASKEHWLWRMRMAERIAAAIEPERFGVAAMYVFGSTKNATAGLGSDLDLLVHFRGNPEQLADLNNWLDGWSLCLGEMNFLRTGYRTERLLDVHIVTDQDIRNRTSFAIKIDAVTDAARPLTLGQS